MFEKTQISCAQESGINSKFLTSLYSSGVEQWFCMHLFEMSNEPKVGGSIPSRGLNPLRGPRRVRNPMVSYQLPFEIPAGTSTLARTRIKDSRPFASREASRIEVFNFL